MFKPADISSNVASRSFSGLADVWVRSLTLHYVCRFVLQRQGHTR